MPELFDFRVEPFPHQLKEFMEARELPYRAQLWEQGTAKSKVVIDTASHLYLDGKIDTALIVAPNGVDENWVTEQIPEHLPEPLRDGYPSDTHYLRHDAQAAHYTLGPCRVQLYRPEKYETKWHMKELRQSIYHEGMLWLCVPYDLYISKRGKKFIWEVLQRRKVFYALDEASSIKTPSAKRTSSIIASGNYAPYRRILEGTPISTGPFDVYAPVRFLDPEFWKRELEIGTALEFRQYFGIYRPRGQEHAAYDLGILVGYRRLDQLNALLQKLGSRILKRDVLKDLPEKLFDKHAFRMNAEQVRVYKQLKEEMIATLPSGATVTAPLAITQMLRLQQVTCGYVPVDDPTGGDDPQPTEPLGTTNPRLESLEYLCGSTLHQGLIWARFHRDLDLICDLLGPKKVVRYDGKVGDEDKQRNKEAFKRGDVQWLAANPAAMARGHTLNEALTSIYYSNSFNLIHRLQSEDRNHRAGQRNAVNYIDIYAPGTVDTRIIANLRNKVDIASQITGDELREWI